MNYLVHSQKDNDMSACGVNICYIACASATCIGNCGTKK